MGPMTEEQARWPTDWLSIAKLPAPLKEGDGPVFLARSPGRIDLLGGEAAFAGALTLSWPTSEECQVAVRRARDRRLLIRLENAALDRQEAEVEWSLDELLARTPAERCRLLLADSRRRFSAHLVPLALRMSREAAGDEPIGLRMLVRSSLPPASGLAASVAVEVAAARALSAAFGLEFDPAGLAALIADEQGFLDPTLSQALPLSLLLAGEGRLLPVLCQPAVPSPPEPLPEGLFAAAIVFTDPERDGRRRALMLQVAAGMAYRIMGDQMGLELAADQPRGSGDPYYGGYLANIDPVTYASEFRNQMPPRLTGERFLAEYDGLAGGRPAVDPAVSYAVRHSAQYVLAEHQRACTFIDALHAASVQSAADRANVLGAQLNQSFEQARALSLVTRRAVFLTQELASRGAEQGLLGVRPSVNQGALALLCRADSGWERAVTGSVAAFEREFGVSPSVLQGSSPGAWSEQALVRIDA